MMMTPLEIKGAVAAVITSVVILVATFTAGGIYRTHIARETEPGNKPLAAEDLAAKAHVAGDGATALTHAVDLTFLYIQIGKEGDFRENVGGFQHALSAESGDDDVSYR